MERLNQKHFYALKLKANYYIDASKYGNETRFINHSCDSNAEARFVYIGD